MPKRSIQILSLCSDPEIYAVTFVAKSSMKRRPLWHPTGDRWSRDLGTPFEANRRRAGAASIGGPERARSWPAMILDINLSDERLRELKLRRPKASEKR
jgi:hypothetical protein